MTLNQLTYFYEAATLQHFNLAAQKQNISEPSLSRAISSLEDEFGVSLFEKKGRNVTLTKAGRILLSHVEQILDDVRRTEMKMHQIATSGGHIDIAYVAPLARTYIPKTVRRFLLQDSNKNVTFHFYQGITTSNVEGLKKGSYDLIFGSYGKAEPDIEFVPIIRQEMVTILPQGHPLCESDFITSDAFSKYPVLTYDKSSGLGKYTADYFKKHGISPDFICESPDENGIASLVAEGFGISLVADVDCIHRDDICIRSLAPCDSFAHTVYMGYIRGRYHLPAVERFIQFIKETSSIPASFN